MTDLKNKKIAILVANGFEQVELTQPKKALEDAGAKTEIISPEKEKVKAWKHAEWGDEFEIDIALEKAIPEHYDALLLPGGVMNPDKLRMNKKAVDFVKQIYDSGKPIAAICHGPWTLINANIVKNHTITSWPSLQTDLINAGAKWVDQEVVVDGKIVSSRKPDDIAAFNQKMIELFSK